MSQQSSIGESYTGPSGGLKKPSLWMASEDLNLGEDLIATVQDVELHKDVVFDAGRKEPKVAAVRFVGREKRMILNSTNRKALVSLFGVDTKAWRNQRVAVYVDPNVKMKGERVNGLRIKAAPSEPMFDIQALTDVGDTKAREGTTALRGWWSTLPTAAKAALKPTLDGSWKQLAESADAHGGAA